MPISSRNGFVGFLAGCVRDSLITEDQAKAYVAEWDDGKIDLHALPLPLDEAITDISDGDVREAIAAARKLGLQL